MKKVLLTLVLLTLLKLSANCQTELGIIGGINLSKMHVPKNFESANSRTLISFHLGLATDFRMFFDLYFQPQILLNGKGGKAEYPYQDTLSIKPFYLEIPLNFLYKKAVKNGNFLMGLGPYIGIGMFGKEKNDYFNGNIKFGNKYNDDMRSLDLGLNLICGYEFKSGPLININYSLGVTDASAGGRFPILGHNRYFGISIGYFLGSGKK